MSSAEPFMPAHRPPLPQPNSERDIDQDVDVLFDPPEVDPAVDFDPHRQTTPYRRPTPGAHLSEEDIAVDFPDEPHHHTGDPA